MGNHRVALVAGGTGGIGEGVVKELLDSNWTVYVPLRPGDSGDRLKAYVSPAIPILIPCDLGRSGDVERLRLQIEAQSSVLDLVVVSVGSSYYGYSLQRIPEDDWNRLLVENLSTHFHLQQEFLGWFRRAERGTYVTLTGPEADFVHPEAGLLSVVAAAQRMMTKVEAAEVSDTAVHVYSVTSQTPIATRARGGQTSPDWLTPADLGRFVMALCAEKPTASSFVLESRDKVPAFMEPSGKRS